MRSYILGLTGQSGAGKTTVCKTFEMCGFYIIDADLVSRYITDNDKDCLAELKSAFGEEYFENGALSRRKLGSLVFAERNELNKLMSITFPYIIDEINSRIEKIEDDNIAVIDAPTLFESGLNKICDKIVCVISDRNLRLKRIIKRDNISEREAEKRFSSQLSESFFRKNSDFLIENNSSKIDLINNSLKTAQKIKEIYYGKKEE